MFVQGDAEEGDVRTGEVGMVSGGFFLTYLGGKKNKRNRTAGR